MPLAQNRAAIPWVGPRTKILTPPKAQRRGHSTDDLRSWNPGVGAEAIRPARQCGQRIEPLSHTETVEIPSRADTELCRRCYQGVYSGVLPR